MVGKAVIGHKFGAHNLPRLCLSLKAHYNRTEGDRISEAPCAGFQPEQDTTTRLEVATLHLHVLNRCVHISETALQWTALVDCGPSANIVGYLNNRFCGIRDLGT